MVRFLGVLIGVVLAVASGSLFAQSRSVPRTFDHVRPLGRALAEFKNDRNYQLLGNMVPHLHVHVVPRYLDDAAPQRPLPFEPSLVTEEDVARRARDLREAMTSG